MGIDFLIYPELSPPEHTNKCISQKSVSLQIQSFCFLCYCVTVCFFPPHKNKQNHLLNWDSEGSKTSTLVTDILQNPAHFHCSSSVHYVVMVLLAIEIMYLFVSRRHVSASVWKCPKGVVDNQWMYDPAVLTGCTYCLHAYPNVDTSTFKNLWGPLYNNWGNVSSIEYCKASWPECLEMCTIFF